MDIIEPVDGPTAWINPAVPVPKGDKYIHLCTGMNRANEAIVKGRHPIPKVEKIQQIFMDPRCSVSWI